MSSSTETKFSNNPNDYPGQWIAWDSAHENIIAAATNLRVLREEVEKLGETDPQIEHGPPLPFKDADKLREGESPNIIDDIMTTIPDAEEWLQTPNIALWERRRKT